MGLNPIRITKKDMGVHVEPMIMFNEIYTHDEAALIIELFENILLHYSISVPSPEDDEREPDDAGLYGSVYSNLLDEVEYKLLDILHRHTPATRIIPDVFP